MNIKTIVKDLCLLARQDRIEYIKNYLKLNQIAFVEQTFQHKITNIEVTINGRHQNRQLIFMAHHDISNLTRQGANDNTSSVAVLLKILSAIKKEQFYYPVKIVFNDTEELIGGIFNHKIELEKTKKILQNAGSFLYLKNYPSKNEIKALFILELSGIGDSLFLAEKSGNIQCNQELNRFLTGLAAQNNFKCQLIPTLSSDMTSAFIYQLNATVLGAIPSYQAQSFLKELEKNHIDNIYRLPPLLMPAVWKNIHSERDTFFAIHEKALHMVYQYILTILDNCQSIPGQA